ncbi:MAG: nitroreductase family protein [Deltaproteobacteria bacterium]|nr:nitroreductase family protein [Deltaproteobacteria bacterium]
MSIFKVAQEKCKKDGICAAVCPMLVIEMKGENGFPSPVDGAESQCIHCGQCVAVCPHGALSLKTMKSDECLPIQKELLPGPDQIKHFLLSRRSIRSYKDQEVERAVLTELINIATYAASGHNWQSVKWLIIEDRGEVKRLNGMVIDFLRVMRNENPVLARAVHVDLAIDSWEKGKDQICRNAPHVVMAYAPKEVPTAQIDCANALTTLELAAFSMGLGACWAGYFYFTAANYPKMIEALEVPEGHQVFGAMMVGYPRYQYKRIPLRNNPSITWR